MTSKITKLSEEIFDAVSTLQNLCLDSNLTLPDLNDFSFIKESESFRSNAEAAKAAESAVAAASQLISFLQPPSTTVLQAASGHIQSAALRVCLESNVVEVLRDAGEQGLHVKDIAAYTKLPAGKLGRILRFLAARNIFREVKPDVFANNRISGILDSKKDVSQILENPQNKHDGSKEQSFPSLMELFSGDLHKSSSYLLENISDPKTGNSDEPTHAPFNRAFGVNVSLFEWYQQPSQAFRFRRFLTAMQGTDELQADDGLLTAIQWQNLPTGSVIVDVGGGWGKASLPLCVKQPHLKFVIQDKGEIVGKGKLLWEAELGDTISNDRVTFQSHDFFKPQPVKNASVFLLKHILHAFSDQYAGKILKALRESATPKTELLVIDTIIPYAIQPGPTSKDDPPDIYGVDNVTDERHKTEMAYISDMTMMLQLNAQERTYEEMKRLLHNSGWKVTEVGKTDDGVAKLLRPLRAVPI